jgi:hypothetical protein
LTASVLAAVNSVIKVLPETIFFLSSTSKRLSMDFTSLIFLIFAKKPCFGIFVKEDQDALIP